LGDAAGRQVFEDRGALLTRAQPKRLAKEA
jgi:hypothetical protein